MDKNEKQEWVKHNCKFEGRADTAQFDFTINSFGIDEKGELYIVTQNKVGAISPSGVIYKIALAEKKQE